MKDFNMEEIKEKLTYGLPDSRIFKVVSKLVVVSDNGSEIEIKNRHKDLIRQIDNREIITEGEYDYIRLQQTKENLQQREKDPYIIIDRELEYKSLNDLLIEIEHKNVKVTLKVYRSKEVRYLLNQI